MTEIKLYIYIYIYIKKQRILPIITECGIIIQKHWARWSVFRLHTGWLRFMWTSTKIYWQENNRHTKMKLSCFKKKIKEVSFSVTYEESMCVPLFALHKSRRYSTSWQTDNLNMLELWLLPHILERNHVFIWTWWSVTTHTQRSDKAFNL